MYYDKVNALVLCGKYDLDQVAGVTAMDEVWCSGIGCLLLSNNRENTIGDLMADAYLEIAIFHSHYVWFVVAVDERKAARTNRPQRLASCRATVSHIPNVFHYQRRAGQQFPCRGYNL